MVTDSHTLERLLGDALLNVCGSFVDDFVRENAQIHASAGLRAKVIRIVARPCCQWCTDLAGSYDYGEQPAEVWQRHNNCDCRVIFKSEKGIYKDAWTKEKFDSYSDAKARRINESTRAEKARRQANIDAQRARREAIERTGQADIRADYLKEATPGKGSLQVLDPHRSIAEKIRQDLGGDITSINSGVFTWRGKRWSAVSTRSAREVEDLLDKALKQRTGGIVLDLRGADPREKLEILDLFEKRIREKQTITIDVMLINDSTIKTITRFYFKK